MTHTEKMRNSLRILVRKLMSRQKDSIKMDLKEVGCEGVKWI
jgi:hypothetical protein